VVAAKHREVKAVLEEWAPVVEAASVDEFYLDLTGTELLYHDEPLEETARRIQAAVMERTGISISIGAATQRVLAKMAASVNKPFGVCVVAPGGEAEFIQRFQVADIPGVGPAFAEALQRRGVTRVRQLLPLDEATLVSWVGESRGQWLYRLARGEHESGGVHARAPQKSLSHERTFARDIADDEELEARLLALVTETGASMRREGYRARTVTVRVRSADFTDKSASRTVADPLTSDRALFAVARALLHQLREKRKGGVRLLGVGVSKLAREGEDGLLLLESADMLDTERDRRVSEAADRIRTRFGKDAVVPARIVERRRGER
jgi:DNA polymerase-4